MKRVFAAVIAALVLLSACSGSAPKVESKPTQAEAAPIQAQAADPAKTRSGTFAVHFRGFAKKNDTPIACVCYLEVQQKDGSITIKDTDQEEILTIGANAVLESYDLRQSGEITESSIQKMELDVFEKVSMLKQ